MKEQNVYLITHLKNHVVSCLMQEGKAVELHCDDEKDQSLLGNIYVGRIRDIAKNIDAAFVEINPGQICYLPLKEIEHPIYTKKGTSIHPQQGDELLVQISREAIKSKYPSVSTNLSFRGKYLLLTTGNHARSVSRKIGQAEQERLLNLTDELMQELSGQFGEASTSAFGLLLRTNASGITSELLKDDLYRLFLQYRHVIAQGMHRTVFSCVLQSAKPYVSRLTNLYEDPSRKILTDDSQIYEEIYQFLKEEQPSDLSKLCFHQDTMISLDKLYSMERQMDEALSERIWLPSGGYLIIQPTEALTVIDVNTGKFEGGKNREKTFLKINREAAKELARQIRLRNISGIIIVDFINMKENSYKEQLLSELRSVLKQDPIPTTLVDMTKLELVEITRMKREKPLLEQIGV